MPGYDLNLSTRGRQIRAVFPAARRAMDPACASAERMGQMLSLVVSTIAYFVASHFITRYLDDIEAPKGFTRSALIFCAAVLVAYGVAFIVDWVVG
jgi:hypothetical protein